MNNALKQESEKLNRSWMEQDAARLRDYLVAGVEDPRINLQSILSRHFLIRALAPERFAELMRQEYRFSAVMNWLLKVGGQWVDPEEPAGILHALRQGADNFEGIPIPSFVSRTFATLLCGTAEIGVPNFIEKCLSGVTFVDNRARLPEDPFDTFRELWSHVLAAEQSAPPISVVEPACGSANDYRFLEAYGIARRLDYTGFDLCEKNIANALSLFPETRFEVGNVFEIPAANKAYDLCFTHDLFEHLSLAGMERAAEELCRVTKRGICIGFFNMDEIEDHVISPVYDYHWNTLSMARTREWFEGRGFVAHVLHIGAFLRRETGCEHTHNPNAYTFVLSEAG